MRFWRDSTQDVAVRWYFCKPGAPLLPYVTTFNSKNWNPDPDWDYQLGEVYAPVRPWTNGQHPGLVPGNHLCGTEEQWRNGESVPGPAPPVWTVGGLQCCQLNPLGGFLLGGAPLEVSADVSIPTGGFVLDGTPQNLDPVAGAVWWLSVEALQVWPPGLNVTLWFDGSPFGRNAVEILSIPTPIATTSPDASWTTAAFQGPDLLACAPFAAGSTYTTFVVAYRQNSTDGGYGPGAGVRIGTQAWLPTVQDPSMAQLVSGAGNTAVLTDLADGWHCYSLRRAGSVTEYREDGTLLNTVTQALGNPPVSQVFRSPGSPGDNALAVMYGEVLFFNAALSTDQDNAAWSYLRSKFGFPG